MIPDKVNMEKLGYKIPIATPHPHESNWVGMGPWPPPSNTHVPWVEGVNLAMVGKRLTHRWKWLDLDLYPKILIS